MPIIVHTGLKAVAQLRAEGLTVHEKDTPAFLPHSPLRIAVVNLMPTKEITETQILRMLAHYGDTVDVSFVRMQSHVSRKGTDPRLMTQYLSSSALCEGACEGLLITGAPVEQLPFAQVDYWQELCQLMDWADAHVKSTFCICWAAQAALYHFYGIEKFPLPQKLFGVFPHRTVESAHKLSSCLPPVFSAPHSRHTCVRASDVAAVPRLCLLAESDEAGVYLVASRSGHQIFSTGHSEYDADTLRTEYERDVAQGLPIAIPSHYFPDQDPAKPPACTWRSHGIALYTGWLAQCVSQLTYRNQTIEEREQA